MAICGLAFVPQVLDLTGKPQLAYALFGPAIASGEWWRIFTSWIEHDGPVHLVANGTSILGFGPVIERRIGSVRLAVVSLIAGLWSSALPLFFDWNRATLCASGIIVGWLGAALLIVEPRWRRVLGQWAIFIVLVSLVRGVSWAGHLGGFIGGLGCGVVIRKSDTVVPPARFRLFDRLAPVLIALAGLAVWAALRFHLPGRGLPR
jgi:rhomboid protease GluP